MRKFYLDVILLIMFLLVISFHFIPKILHEVLGLLMFAIIITHFKWNFNAFKSLKGTTKKRLSMLIDIAMLICMVVITFTGICISNHIFNGMIDMRLQRNITIHQLHVSLPFLFMILSGVHLGLHWQGFRQRINNILNVDMTSKFYKFASLLLMAILIIAGIYGSFLDRIGDRLLMEHIFATEATSLPFAAFILLMSGIFTLYVIIGMIISKYIR